VLPSQYGIQRKWYFLFTPTYWRSVLSSCARAPTRVAREDEALLTPVEQLHAASAVDGASAGTSARDKHGAPATGTAVGTPSGELGGDFEPVDHRREVVASLRNLSKTYDDGTRALVDFNLDLYEGEILGFLGCVVSCGVVWCRVVSCGVVWCGIVACCAVLHYW
jgi:hypothetical protein